MAKAVKGVGKPMSRSLRVIIMSAAVSSTALLVLGLGPLSAAQAAPSAAAVKVPNPCKTFTPKSADALFGVSSKTHLPAKETKSGSGKFESLECTVTHGTVKLNVTVVAFPSGFGGPEVCYSRPKLGASGKVCVSDMKRFHFTFATFRKHGITFYDDYNVTLPKKGARLYTFALAQYKAYKG